MTTFELCVVHFFESHNFMHFKWSTIDHAITVILLMLSCSPDICLCRYLEGQNTSCICSGSLTYHFLYVIAFTRDTSSLVLGKFGAYMCLILPHIFIQHEVVVLVFTLYLFWCVENAGLIWMTSVVPSDGISALILVNFFLILDLRSFFMCVIHTHVI